MHHKLASVSTLEPISHLYIWLKKKRIENWNHQPKPGATIKRSLELEHKSTHKSIISQNIKKFKKKSKKIARVTRDETLAWWVFKEANFGGEIYREEKHLGVGGKI